MLKWIVAPVVGGVIGYITNDLAIKMLFRPRKAVYIGRLHVPFTPGLIPAQQGRIARSIGAVISNQLLNEETLRKTLLSEKAIGLLQGKVREIVQQFAKEQRTVRDLLEERFPKETIRHTSDALEKKLIELICEKLDEAKLGHIIIDSVMGHFLQDMAQNRLFTMLMDAKAQAALKEKFARKIDEIVHDMAPGAVKKMIVRYRADLMNTPICDIYRRFGDREDMLIDRLTDFYTSILGNNLGKLLRAINIEKIVEDKINAFDAAQLETMIFDLMKRELNAIVYLGAILGFFMGFINVLF